MGQTELRQLYRPVQPVAQLLKSNIAYTELLPCPELQLYIYYYWQLKTEHPLEQAFDYKIVADGCIDIFFDMNAPGESFAMGFSNSFTQFRLDKQFHYTGIRFLPMAFPMLYNIKASELTNHTESLYNISKKTAGYISAYMQPSLHYSGIKSLLDRHFLQLVACSKAVPDGRLEEAVSMILGNAGMLRIEKELDASVSPRQLRRLFYHYIGGTPKVFSNVVRFQNLLQAKPSAASLKKNKLFFDAGYYDQAHFIKEFKTFYGDTPFNALK